jgi:hypothetical protein
MKLEHLIYNIGQFGNMMDSPATPPDDTPRGTWIGAIRLFFVAMCLDLKNQASVRRGMALTAYPSHHGNLWLL